MNSDLTPVTRHDFSPRKFIAPEVRQRNERVVRCFLAQNGGVDAVVRDEIHLEDLGFLFYAGPEIDLTRYDQFPDDLRDHVMRIVHDEPLLTPFQCVRWLNQFNRAAASKDGMWLPNRHGDFLSLAGCAIANGNQPQHLSTTYRTLRMDYAGISDDFISFVAERIDAMFPDLTIAERFGIALPSIGSGRRTPSPDAITVA